MPRKKKSEEELKDSEEPKAAKGDSPESKKAKSKGTSQKKDEWINEENITAASEKPESPAEEASLSQLPLSDQEARTWGMLAHLSILLNLISGWVGMLAALIIYLVYKDRSRFVAYHAMQSLVFQAITWVGAGIVGGIFIGIGSALGFLIIPLLCLIPGILILLLIPASLIYGVIGAVQVNNGEDFRYWQVGDWVRGILEPKPAPQQQDSVK
jgi:uncharacterized Tic20 family protein